MNRTQIHLVDEEVDFPSSEQLVSTTDLQGVITYANDHFCRVAGYSRAEMIGQHHNMVRHPDMPKAAFADLWGKLKQVMRHDRPQCFGENKQGRKFVSVFSATCHDSGPRRSKRSYRNQCQQRRLPRGGIRLSERFARGDYRNAVSETQG